MFKDSLQKYNQKDVVPILKIYPKLIQFYHNQGIYMSKLGFTFPFLFRFQNYVPAQFYQFCEGDKDLFEKLRDDMTIGTSVVFTRKAVLIDETFIRLSSIICKPIDGIDASQFYQ